LPPKKAKEVEIEVTIRIDKNGLLNVMAEEISTNVIKSKEMKREGNYYKQNDKDTIKRLFLALL
jgi:molecular chaperone DnaK (HSP70)